MGGCSRLQAAATAHVKGAGLPGATQPVPVALLLTASRWEAQHPCWRALKGCPAWIAQPSAPLFLPSAHLNRRVWRQPIFFAFLPPNR